LPVFYAVALICVVFASSALPAGDFPAAPVPVSFRRNNFLKALHHFGRKPGTPRVLSFVVFMAFQ
jgi:hypothetical protein